MYYPGSHAESYPDHPALIVAGTDVVMSYRTLDQQSRKISEHLRERGLVSGDHVAIFMENHPSYFEVVWAALRSGLVITPVNRYFTADEAAYVVNDCGARALFVSGYVGKVAEELVPELHTCDLLYSVDEPVKGYEALEPILDAIKPARSVDEPAGQIMFYSSGTTGRPKGIYHQRTPALIKDGYPINDRLVSYGMGRSSIYLSPAPIYHAAPLAHSIGVQSLGGTVVMMPRFDASEALRCIEEYRITHSQWVPTMFVRMLKLAEEERLAADLSSHQVALHAAAPCPVEVKRQMIDWWGPILLEYYAGSEGNGSTLIDSEEWLQKPGSVGRASIGTIHICDDDGQELPAGEEGLVYFERDELTFSYHKDEAKTRSSQHPQHETWTALGDVGYLDEDGYLFLTDRKSFMIISGGVNIYPQAIENALVLHEDVADVAVIGVPNPDFGEEVKAVVELLPGIEPTSALEDDLIAFARERVANYMVPRSIDFTEELPRLPTGKLYKHKLREKYWPTSDVG